AVALRQIGDAAYLSRGDASDGNQQAGVVGRQTGFNILLLRMDAEVGGVVLLTQVGPGFVQRLCPPFFQLRAEPFDAAIIDQESQASAGAASSAAMIAKDARDGAAQIRGFVRRNEDIER